MDRLNDLFAEEHTEDRAEDQRPWRLTYVTSVTTDPESLTMTLVARAVTVERLCGAPSPSPTSSKRFWGPRMAARFTRHDFAVGGTANCTSLAAGAPGVAWSSLATTRRARSEVIGK